MKFIYLLLLSFCFTGCYTINQGYYQLKLLASEKTISSAIKDNQNNPDRLQKLLLVKQVLDYAKDEVGLTPRDSYQNFIELNSPYVVWVVQAAQKRELKLNTWWFPFVGKQPYLGFFKKEDALAQREKMLADNYDVSLGGVKAFSLLGYFSDPLYSSMVDGESVPNFIETLIHESVHRTIYVKNNYAFNENLANFIARKATQSFLQSHTEIAVNLEEYVQKFKRKQIAQKKFNEFYLQTKKELEKFYADAKLNTALEDDNEFLKARQAKFVEISKKYLLFMHGVQKNTDYDFAFKEGYWNNAVFLSYGVYEENQETLEEFFVKSNSNLKNMIQKTKVCLENKEEEVQILESLTACFEGRKQHPNSD